MIQLSAKFGPDYFSHYVLLPDQPDRVWLIDDPWTLEVVHFDPSGHESVSLESLLDSLQSSLQETIDRQQEYSILVSANFLLRSRLMARITRQDACCSLETRTLKFTPLQGIPAPVTANILRPTDSVPYLEIRWSLETEEEEEEEAQEEEEEEEAEEEEEEGEEGAT